MSQALNLLSITGFIIVTNNNLSDQLIKFQYAIVLAVIIILQCVAGVLAFIFSDEVGFVCVSLKLLPPFYTPINQLITQLTCT